ncbi:MAG TPA: methyltransferase domain-containing protein [Candidatus Paceibacterota bacterium]
MKHDTSWGKVADWYDEYLDSDDSYQKAVILPNLLRILDPKKSDTMLDIACGQGFFTERFARNASKVFASDISGELVGKAQRRFAGEGIKNASFYVKPAHDLSFLPAGSIDKATCVLAAQNIKELDGMFKEAARAITKGGKLVLVLNHPSFRVPQGSDWHFNNDVARKEHDPNVGKQGRVVYQYLNEAMIKIDMNPGTKQGEGKKQFTISYHRPLQVFVKWLTKHGFAVTRIEEWSSHKKSQPGPKAKAEDAARKEIPLFMCIEATLIN